MLTGIKKFFVVFAICMNITQVDNLGASEHNVYGNNRGQVQSSDWPICDYPSAMESVAFNINLSTEQFESLQCGMIPSCMEDKWFVYYQDGHLYFHRSWTGILIFDVSIIDSVSGYTVTGMKFNIDRSQCTLSKDQAIDTVTRLIEWVCAMNKNNIGS